MSQMTRRTFLGLTLPGAAGFLIACGAGGTEHGSSHGAAAGQGSPGTAEYDQTFIDAMAPHHQAAIDMAKIAQDKAEHAELKGLATAIATDQEGEIAQMKAWRKAWYGSDTIPAGAGGHQMGGMDVDLRQLEAARPFDRAFIDAMIPHHQSALEMAREAGTKAKHQEIKDLAARIATAQQREIEQMRAWRAQWYPGQ